MGVSREEVVMRVISVPKSLGDTSTPAFHSPSIPYKEATAAESAGAYRQFQFP